MFGTKKICSEFPTCKTIPKELHTILLKRAIQWIPEIEYRKVAIKKIMESMTSNWPYEFNAFETDEEILLYAKKILDKIYSK